MSTRRVNALAGHLSNEAPVSEVMTSQCSAVNEDADYNGRVAACDKWMKSERFRYITRPYTAETVVNLSGSAEPQFYSGVIAAKFYDMIRGFKNRGRGEYSHTFGCLDTVQVTQMAAHLSSIYVSGWQSSSTASSSNEPGPDVADYPMDTVPNKVDQLFRAQLFHDRKQYEARRRMTAAQRASNPAVDYLRPIVADADTGHGGHTAVMKLTKMMIEAGASGIHLEDQKPGTKKCGHMGGKVLVATGEHVTRLIAARLQADIMRTATCVVARTDASAASLLDSNHDPRDQPFILGATNRSVEPFAVATREGRGAGWDAAAGIKTYPEAVRAALGNDAAKVAQWDAKCYELGLPELKALAKTLGVQPFFCWEAARTVEGYYRIKGSTEFCIQRARAFAPYCDLIWMETAKPALPEAKKFADGVHAKFPQQMLAYNLSPSFNWDAAGLSDEEIRTFVSDLGALGFVWQFITLAGFHSDSLGITRFARDYAARGMLAYVAGVQRQERDDRVETLTHQKWSGTELIDAMQGAVTSGLSSTSTMGSGVTESQFGAH